jgi:hypothetical protein
MEDKAQGRDRFGGKAFVVSDQTPCAFSDINRLLNITTNGETRIVEVSPLPLLLIGYVLEFYHVNRYRLISIAPFLKNIFPPLGSEIVKLQTPIFYTGCVHCFIDDSLARKSPKEGGLGYKSPFTTIMGLSKTVEDFLAGETSASDGNMIS